MSTDQKPISQEELFEANEARRHELARLPIEEKIAALITMQQWESEIASHTGRAHQAPWKLKNFENQSNKFL